MAVRQCWQMTPDGNLIVVTWKSALVCVVGAWLGLACACVGPNASAAASACPVVMRAARTGPSEIEQVAAAIARAVPRLYGSMTNQTGREAWRGYSVVELTALAQDHP